MATMSGTQKGRRSTISKALTAWREKKSLSQREAAEFFEVSLDTWHSWERGRRKPNRHALKLLKQIGVEI